MEILIPTNDGLAIAPDFENASSVRLLTVINGMVREDAIRPVENIQKDLFPSDHSAGDPLSHQTVITRGILPGTERNLQKINCEVFHTQETNIINALNFYLKNVASMESNYCCCP